MGDVQKRGRPYGRHGQFPVGNRVNNSRPVRHAFCRAGAKTERNQGTDERINEASRDKLQGVVAL